MVNPLKKKNKASFLLLPMLGPNQEFFDWSHTFVNCYIMDFNFPEYNNHIILLYDYGEWLSPSNLSRIIKVEERLYYDVKANLVKRYEPDTRHSVFIYEVPKDYASEYNLFIEGKYSKLSPQYKIKILEFHNKNQYKGLVGVLSRDKTMLSNLHKNLGCMNKSCSCNHLNYLNCSHFRPYDFDFSTAEVWDKVNTHEILDIEIQDYKRIQSNERIY